LLLLMLGSDSTQGPAAAILIGAVVCCAAAIAGDNMQDLKSGHILGATPYKQQFMQTLGTVAGAMVVAPVLNLLQVAYGFGAKSPEHPMALAAPQATLMQSVAQGVFGGNLPWDFMVIGLLMGIVIIVVDEYLRRRGANFRMPILAVAVGLYLPFELDSAIMLGGILSWLIVRYQKRQEQQRSRGDHQAGVQRSDRTGLLFASGLITGEALVGILIAIPIAVTGSGDVLQVLREPLGSWPGLILLLGICGWLLSLAKKSYHQTS
jgi:putative OPT family oligopeptide transporter